MTIGNSNCTTCIHSGSRCFCPPDKFCTAYEKKDPIVKHIFEFEVHESWTPGKTGCVHECPFSFNIPLGQRCKVIETNNDIKCPFLREKDQ